jgi:hypothetical protein
MLDGVGRTSGANAARDEATVALGAMGAHGLLRRHGLEVAATTA